MAPKKSSPPIPLRPLPIRIARLHAKLAIAASVGLSVIAALTLLDMHWRMRALSAAGTSASRFIWR